MEIIEEEKVQEEKNNNFEKSNSSGKPLFLFTNFHIIIFKF